MTRQRIAVDLRQFFRQPYASGVQRVLLGLLESWPHDLAEPIVIGQDADRIVLLSDDAATRCLRACFEATPDAPVEKLDLGQLVKEQLTQEATVATSWPEVLLLVDRFLIAEPSGDIDLLEEWESTNRVMSTSLIFYDALPESNPEFFHPRLIPMVSRYAQLAATIPRVASISEAASTVLRTRLRNAHPDAAAIALPGADHVALQESPLPPLPVFIGLSSVEPRKRFGVLLNAFAAAHSRIPNAKLNIIGRHAGDPEFSHSLASLPASAVSWTHDANDQRIDSIASSATALFTIGEEGFGLPALEMLRRGCPVIFAGTQPAAELFEGSGALRLTDASIDSVAEVMIRLADPGFARSLRESIRAHELPTWGEFARTVVETTLR